MYFAQPHQAKRYRQDERYQVLSGNDGAYSYIGYNLRRPLFKDVRVRRALGMAVDVNAIIKYVLAGEGKRATGPYYSNTPYSDPHVTPLPYDPKAALELLAQAGWRKNSKGLLEKDGKFRVHAGQQHGNLQRTALIPSPGGVAKAASPSGAGLRMDCVLGRVRRGEQFRRHRVGLG